jgi:hypothetical protein
MVITDFKVGDRIQLHPATDLWAFGVKYGNVLAIGRKLLHVKLDNGWKRRVNPANVLEIVL